MGLVAPVLGLVLLAGKMLQAQHVAGIGDRFVGTSGADPARAV
jgi:hypothetical protein